MLNRFNYNFIIIKNIYLFITHYYLNFVIYYAYHTKPNKRIYNI